MLKISNPEHFEKVAAFAESKGEATWAHFWRNVYRAHVYADFAGERDEIGALAFVKPGQRDIPAEWATLPGLLREKTFSLGYDSAPASFGFNAETIFGRLSGAIVYHGDQAGWQTFSGRVIGEGEDVGTFSVRIGDTGGDPWSWHS